jgi:hypothetical protein
VRLQYGASKLRASVGGAFRRRRVVMHLEPVRRVLDDLGVRYALIGGHALAARGYPRLTVDVDLLTTERRVLDGAVWTALAVDPGAEIEVRRGDDDDPLAGVVHILLADGTDIDVIVGRWKWETAVIDRAEVMTIADGVTIPVVRVSDLLLLKLAAGGYGDLRDAAVLIAAGQRDVLIAEVESRIDEVRPDVREVWRELLRSTD